MFRHIGRRHSVAVDIGGGINQITRSVLEVDRFRTYVESLKRRSLERAREISLSDGKEKLSELVAYRDRVVTEIRREYKRLHKDFRMQVDEALQSFEAMMDELILGMSAKVAE